MSLQLASTDTDKFSECAEGTEFTIEEMKPSLLSELDHFHLLSGKFSFISMMVNSLVV